MPGNPHHYVNLRYWTSEEARAQAHEDPEVHRFWARLGLLMNMLKVYERLERVNPEDRRA